MPTPRFPIGEHQETWPIRSQTFKRYLAKRFFDEEGKAMNSDALSAAINLIEAKALFEGENTRYTSASRNTRARSTSTCVTQTGRLRSRLKGWQVLGRFSSSVSPIEGHVATTGARAGGSIDRFLRFLNVDDETWRRSWRGWWRRSAPVARIQCWRCSPNRGPGKSTTGRFLRDLVDPNATPLRAEPRDGRDLMIAANNSGASPTTTSRTCRHGFPDAFCRLSTGGGFATRELYTDQDEVIFVRSDRYC